jgi:hypothetical protein
MNHLEGSGTAVLYIGRTVLKGKMALGYASANNSLLLGMANILSHLMCLSKR